MKENELKIDRRCHAVYSKQCKAAVLEKIRLHYPAEEADAIFEQVQHQYERYLDAFERRDLGGSKNPHNGVAGTYDCIMIVCYYVTCKEKSSFAEIEEMTKVLTVDHFGTMSFIDLDKPIFKRLMYLVFRMAKKKCQRWGDYEMQLDPYSKEKPIHYCFTRCPFADFVHQFGLEEIAGALCNVDYPSMEAMNVRLVRRHTCIEGDHCDYTFYSPNDPHLKDCPEYVDEMGFIRNK